MGCSKRDTTSCRTCRRKSVCVLQHGMARQMSSWCRCFVTLLHAHVRAWSCLRKSAGDSHDVAALGDILGDRMLQAWKQRGDKLQKDDM